MKNPRLSNWSLDSDGSLYDAPECRRIFLRGAVFGHPNPRFEEGKRISTSHIKKIDGCQVTTHSGSVYTLTYPNPDYVKWCQENGHHIPTPEEPIKLL